MSKIYFIERRLNKVRIKHLKSLAEKSDLFHVCEQWHDAAYLIASETNADEAISYIAKNFQNSDHNKINLTSKQLVDISWFFKCIKTKLLQCVDNYKLVFDNKSSSNDSKHAATDSTVSSNIPTKKICFGDNTVTSIAMYACQAAAPLIHYNKKFCDALEILEMHALYRGDKNSEARALAFRRGSASLKAFHKEIVNEDDLKNVPYIGLSNASTAKAGHCKKVILEILSEGFSDEVESLLNSEFYQTMKRFCGIFGVGPVTARKWYHTHQLRTLHDLKAANLQLTHDQKFGVQYYDDLNTPVTVEEANCILNIIKKACNIFDKSITVTLSGGFRRGKLEGHDVDLLLRQSSYSEKNVIEFIIDHLKDNFIYTDKKMLPLRNADSASNKEINISTIDHFDKCFSIFKFNYQWLNQPPFKDKCWKAVRLDLVVVPKNQFAFALLGWTGSKHFEREIRRYAKNEKQIILTSHGMFMVHTKQSIFAASEEEIFQKLGLEFRQPNERCF